MNTSLISRVVRLKLGRRSPPYSLHVASIRTTSSDLSPSSKPNDSFPNSTAKNGSQAPIEHSNAGELPAFSFSSLGASRSVKIVLFAALGLIGTAETYFYARAGLQWYRGEERSINAELVDDEGPVEVAKGVDVAEAIGKGDV